MNSSDEFSGHALQNTGPHQWLPFSKDQPEPFGGTNRGSAESLPPLSPEVDECVEQEHILRVGQTSSLKDVLARLSGSGWEKSAEAFRQLDSAGIEACLKALHELEDVSEDNANHVRVAAIEVLGSLGEHAPIEPLVVALADPFWDVRAAAAQALGKLGKWTPVKFLMKMLDQEKDESVREALVRALGQQGTRMPVDRIIAFLRYDESWLVRQAAAWALGMLGSGVPVKWLAYALQHDEDESVRATAAASLGLSRKQKVRGMLFEALLDPEEDVRKAAQKAIKHLEGEIQQEDGQSFPFSLLVPILEKEIEGISSVEVDTHPGDDSRGDTQDEIATVDILLKDQEEDLFLPENNSLVFLDEEASSYATASPVWGESWQERIFHLLMEFLREKRGPVGQPRMLKTEQGSTLLLTCFYQYSTRLWETLLHSAQHAVTSIEAALIEHDETVGQALEQAFDTWGQRTWADLVVVSFTFPYRTKQAREEKELLRVVLSGMSGRAVRRDDASVLNQIVNLWAASSEEHFIHQRCYDVTDLKIWYQQSPELPALFSAPA